MSVTCRHVEQLHDAYVDGELSASMTAEVHAHLLQCPACQHEVEMVRACGDVISTDLGEPELDAGFASRVLVSVSKHTKPATANLRIVKSLETRRSRRERLLRSAFVSGLPAVAAVLFFGILIRPGTEPVSHTTRVAGVAVEKSGVKDMVEPTLNAVQDTQRAVEGLNRLCEIAVGNAADGASKAMERAKQAKNGETVTGPSILNFIFPTFDEFLSPTSAHPTPPAEDEPGVVRF